MWTGKEALVLILLMLCYGQRSSHSRGEIPSSKEVKVTLLPHFSWAGVVRGCETKMGSVRGRTNADRSFSQPSASCLQASLLALGQSFLSDHTWMLLAPHLSLTWLLF